MKIKVSHKGRNFFLNVRKLTYLGKGTGLTFRTKETKPLLFDFEKDVYYRGALTSLFVFFPFLALWLDKSNNVLEYKIIKPFKLKILPAKPFRKFVEIPINRKNRRIIDFFVGKHAKV